METTRTVSRPPSVQLGLNPELVLHKGAVLGSLVGHEKVLHAWSRTERRAIVVTCDAAGEPVPDQPARTQTRLPASFCDGTPQSRLPAVRRIVKSANPAIPSGVLTDNPNLIVVPAGPTKGRMFGELTPEEIQALSDPNINPALARVAAASQPGSLPRRDTLEPAVALAPVAAEPKPEEKQALNREAYLERMKQQTRLMNQLPLPRIMEEMYGYGGEKSGAGLKYNIDGDILLRVETEGGRFGALNGHKFACFGAGGSGGAINLVQALEEARGRQIDFTEAKRLLSAHFASELPALPESGRRIPRAKIVVGEVNPAVWFHKGAIIQPLDGSGKAIAHRKLVLDGWSSDTKKIRMVDVDDQGQRIEHDGKASEPIERTIAVEHPVAGDLALGGTWSVMLKSANNQIRPGARSDDPGLLLAPFGPCSGMMLGQLSEAQLDHLAVSSNAPRLREAILFTVPRRFAPGVNTPKKEAEKEEEVERPLPARLSELKVDLRVTKIPDSKYVISRDGHFAVLDNERIARDYLIEGRKIPAEIADAALQAGAAYPTESVIYRKDPVTQETTDKVWFHNPALCIPISGLETGKVIAHQIKTIHLDPAIAQRNKGKDSHNFGPVQQGFAVIGQFNPGTTNEIVLTEAWLDGMSYWSLNRPDPTTCVKATTGSRIPMDLIAKCKENGISLVRALDNDHAGRTMSRKIGAACKEAGVATRDELVAPSEIEVGFKDNERGRQRLDETMKFAVENRIMIIQQPTRNGWIRVVVDNTEESAERLSKMRDEDRIERQRENRDDKHVTVEVVNKDWNDLIKGSYRRSFSAEFEREFYAREPEAVAASIVEKKAMEIEVAGGPKADQQINIAIGEVRRIEPTDKDSALKGSGPATIDNKEQTALGVSLAAGDATVLGTSIQTATAAPVQGMPTPTPTDIPEKDRVGFEVARPTLRQSPDVSFEEAALRPLPRLPSTGVGGGGFTPSEHEDGLPEL